MCTSLTYKTADQSYLLARTMDFGFELEARPVVIPRNYSWTTKLGEEITTRYGFAGAGRKLTSYILADGVNEHGLSIAELYHPNKTTYSDGPKPEKRNLAPYEFITWVLGSLKSISELREQIGTINLTNEKIELINQVPPLHYILTDAAGASIVIETTDGQPVIKENPVGVMTNSPSFEWHLENLHNYLHIKPTNFANQVIGDLELHPFGQGSGTNGLPGGYTSPERFVRTTFIKHFTTQAENSEAALNTIFKILNGVTIPKGANIKDDGATDYTQYRGIMDATNKTFYFNPYDSNEIFAVRLTETLLNAVSPAEFPVEPKLQVQVLSD